MSEYSSGELHFGSIQEIATANSAVNEVLDRLYTSRIELRHLYANPSRKYFAVRATFLELSWNVLCLLRLPADLVASLAKSDFNNLRITLIAALSEALTVGDFMEVDCEEIIGIQKHLLEGRDLDGCYRDFLPYFRAFNSRCIGSFWTGSESDIKEKYFSY